MDGNHTTRVCSHVCTHTCADKCVYSLTYTYAHICIYHTCTPTHHTDAHTHSCTPYHTHSQTHIHTCRPSHSWYTTVSCDPNSSHTWQQLSLWGLPCNYPSWVAISLPFYKQGCLHSRKSTDSLVKVTWCDPPPFPTWPVGMDMTTLSGGASGTWKNVIWHCQLSMQCLV